VPGTYERGITLLRDVAAPVSAFQEMIQSAGHLNCVSPIANDGRCQSMKSAEGMVVIIMGSKRDQGHVQKIVAQLDQFGIAHEARIASAHKSAAHLLRMLSGYSASGRTIVYITVAGRSNALAGMVDANVSGPVITCPPTSSVFGGADIYSSLRMPTGVAPMVVLEPEAAALAAAKCLALSDSDLRQQLRAYRDSLSRKIVEDDRMVKDSGEG